VSGTSHTSCDRPNKIYKLRHCSKHLGGKVVATRTIYQKHKVAQPTFGGTALEIFKLYIVNRKKYIYIARAETVIAFALNNNFHNNTITA